MSSRQWLSIAAAVVSLGLAAGAFAQTVRGRQSGPMYDTRTETRVAGVARDVTATSSSGRATLGLGGVHLTLETSDARVTVHLGPAAFMKQHGVEIADGDRLEILGSRVTLDGAPVLLARQVTKGAKTVQLRDHDGRPLWRGGRH